MACGLYVRQVQLEGDWKHLFFNLPGWAQYPTHSTDGDRYFYDKRSPAFAFEARTDETWKHVGKFAETNGHNKATVKTPGGMNIDIYRRATAPVETDRYTLNHVALNVTDLDAEQPWWQELLRPDKVMRVDNSYDPVLEGPLSAVHFYSPSLFYVTLRAAEPAQTLDHFGFEVGSPEAFADARKIIRHIGWEIIWEGHIDKSRVIHFVGPDNRVHDFFYPTEELRQSAE